MARAFRAGKKVYWNELDKVVTADESAGANKYVGKSILAASDDDVTALVRLSSNGYA